MIPVLCGVIVFVVVVVINFNYHRQYRSRGLKTKPKSRTTFGTAAFHPRGLCGRRYPRQRPHCSIELMSVGPEKIILGRKILLVEKK